MKISQKYPLETLIYVDEFTVVGKEEEKQGRNYDTKNNNNIVKRVYIKFIDDYFAKSLTSIFEEHISTFAKIITDK